MFIKETHQVYYDRFSTAFGSVIKETFFDEPTMYRAKGRMWTPLFNEKYTAYYHGESPELLYPALWYDIGNDTQYARNRLFGFRSKLYAEGFMKTIQNWGTAHNIHATGHQDQEEILNPYDFIDNYINERKVISENIDNLLHEIQTIMKRDV